MGNQVKKKKDMKFQSHEALQRVQAVIDDADKALHQKSRRMKDSPIQSALGGALGAGLGSAVGFAGLYFGGIVGLSGAGIMSGLAAAGALVGAGAAAGIAVLAAPAVILAGTGVGIAAHIKHKKLMEAKDLVYKEAVRKQTAIIKALKEERDADKERMDYLNGLNILLEAAIKDLKYDLGIS